MPYYNEETTTGMRVPIWDGSGNFNAWTDKVMTALQDKGCAIAVVRDLCRVTADEPLKHIFSAADYKTDGQAASVIKNALSDIHDGQFTDMTAFEIWAELKKLYSMQSADDLVNKIIDLFNFRMAPDGMDGRKFLVQFNFLRKKIDLTGLTCDNLINLILLASLNKHYEPSEIFKFGSTLSNRMKAQAEWDEKHGEVTVAAAANSTHLVCKHCNCIGHTIDTCWTRNGGGSGNRGNSGGNPAGDDLGDDAHRFYKLTPSTDSNCAELDMNSNDEYARNNNKAFEREADNMYEDCDDGYKPARYDGYGPARDDGYEPAHMDDYTEALPDHAMDVYDCTFGDGRNGSASGDGYSDDGGDVAAHYDDTFITAAEHPATPYHMPGTIQERFSDYLERLSTCNHGVTTPTPAGCLLRYAAIKSHAQTQNVYEMEADNQFNGYLWAQAAVAGPTSFKQAMASSDCSKWQEAIIAKLKSIDNNGVLKIVPHRGGMHVLSTRWVFVTKPRADGQEPLYKGRLVA
ncbi:hypothetical protein LPJ69_004632 [Coemansia sp. RSA 1752]|nr:hypothetical protein LPJ69_004632 [Coemansia sp. RSA 1752]